MRRLVMAIAVALLWAAPAAARPLAAAAPACVRFTGATADWDVPGNWSTGALPGPGDDVCIPPRFPIVTIRPAGAAARSLDAPATSLAVGGDLAIGSGGATVAGLDVTAGTLASAGPLAATSVNLHGGSLGGAGDETITYLGWSAGALSGPGTTTVTDEADLGTVTLAGRTLGLAGTTILTSGGKVDGTGTLASTGTLHANGATIAVPLTNDGTVAVDGGILTLAGGGAGRGGYAVAADAVLDWAHGAYALAAPQVTGAGTARVSGATVATTGTTSLGAVAVTGGSLSAGGPLNAGLVSLSGGTLGGTGDLGLAGLAWSGGSLADSGTTTVGAAGLTVGADGASLAGGTLVLSSNSTLGGPLTVDGRLDLAGGVTISGPGPLVNTASGTLRKSGAGTADLQLPVDNRGTIEAAGGELRIASLAGYDAATGVLGGGTYDLAATLTVPGADVTVNAAKELRLEPHGALSDGAADGLAHLATNTGTLEVADSRALAGGLTNTGTVRISGATLTLAGAYVQTDGRTTLDGGTLQGGSPAQLAGGRLEGSGTVAPGLRNAATVAPSGPLTVSGDYAQTAGGVLAAPGGALAVVGTATLAGTLLVDPYAAAWAGRSAVSMLTAAAVTGRWTLQLTDPIAGAAFDVDYDTPGAATLNRRAILPPLNLAVSPTAGPGVTPVPVPAPVAGKSATAAATGSVLVQVPGQAGGFVALGGAPTNLPAGTVVDARHGSVNLTAASSYTNPNAPRTEISVAAAIFRIRQERARDGHTAVTDLVLLTPPGAALACAARKGVARPRHRTIRRIRAKVRKGVVRTLAAAAVLKTRNATFAMRDRCDGTSSRLTQGKATVFNRVSGRRARLRAARRAYFVRARLFAVRQARLRKIPKP